MQNDIVEKNVKYNTEEILGELEQCREDERNSQNQVIQVIVTAGTVLTLIFGITSFEKVSNRLLFHLSNLVLCTTFGYITSLGISAVLRYHYMRNLEDMLFKANEASKIVHWNSFSSSITTRNPKHMYNIYTKMHYLSYSLAAVCPILFCIVITLFQFFSIKYKNIIDNLGILFLLFFLSLCMFIYFISSIRARLIYKKAMEISLREQSKRINEIIMSNINISENENNKIRIKDILKVTGYFIYPKKKDIQKLFLLIIGFLTGCFLKNDTYQLNILELKNMLIVCFVIDCLLYQARYQWNDIRGVKEDTDTKKTDRLPISILGKHRAIIISSVILIIKIIAAFSITLHFKNKLGIILLTFMVIIILCAVMYEIARSLKKGFLIFFFVSFGYAIRFSVGLWSAYPEIWNEGFRFCNITTSRLIIISLIISYALLGEYSVVLSWLQEALFQNIKGIDIKKDHYKYLFEKLKKNCKWKNNKKNLSLKQRGKLVTIWNVPYIISIVLLGLMGLITNFDLTILFLEFIVIIFSGIISTSGTKNMKLYISVLIGIYIIKVSYSLCGFKLFLLYIYITQFIFTFIYLFLRFIFKPDFDFITSCKNVVVHLLILFIGKETYLFLKSDLNTK